ncbi:EF-hand domain-containing protein [Sulfitobacter sp. S190]|uniref:EF-hand domain-containing protein n=1 Tax=Sulfitobacter sp. S190 TaxID=2867022 RepID=UPI0021A6B4F1|nr:EF-hand domain-containing protein [Sulfitobacter sp. S190]
MIKITFTAAAIVAGLLASHADAREDKPARAAAMFERLDANSDGKLSLAEIEARSAERFARADANNDGALSIEELRAAGDARRAKRADRMMQRLDANDDGSLTRAEMEARRNPAEMLARLDTDKDGALSAEEFAEARQHHRHGKKGKPASE